MGEACTKEQNFSNYSDFNMMMSSEFGQAGAQASGQKRDKLYQDPENLLTPPQNQKNRVAFGSSKKLQLTERSEQRSSNI